MRTTQQIIASFPAAIAVDLDGLHCKSRYAVVTPGERGYTPLYSAGNKTLAEVDEMVVRQYNTRKPTEPERRAALNGSMFGWDVPGADPENPFNADPEPEEV